MDRTLTYWGQLVHEPSPRTGRKGPDEGLQMARNRNFSECLFDRPSLRCVADKPARPLFAEVYEAFKSAAHSGGNNWGNSMRFLVFFTL